MVGRGEWAPVELSLAEFVSLLNQVVLALALLSVGFCEQSSLSRSEGAHAHGTHRQAPRGVRAHVHVYVYGVCLRVCMCMSRVACHGSRVAACAFAEALSRAPCASSCVLCSERLTDWPLEEVIGGTIGPQRAVVVHGAWSRAQADGS